jgi:hypothetical protein
MDPKLDARETNVNQESTEGLASVLPAEYQPKTIELLSTLLGHPSSAGKNWFQRQPIIQETAFPGEVRKFVTTDLPTANERYLLFDTLFTARDNLSLIKVNAATLATQEAAAAVQAKTTSLNRIDGLLKNTINGLPDKPPTPDSISPREEACRAYYVHRLRFEIPEEPLPSYMIETDRKYGAEYRILAKAKTGELDERKISQVVGIVGSLGDTRVPGRAAIRSNITRNLKSDLMIALADNDHYIPSFCTNIQDPLLSAGSALAAHACELLSYQTDTESEKAALLTAKLFGANHKLPYEFITRFGVDGAADKSAIQQLLHNIPEEKTNAAYHRNEPSFRTDSRDYQVDLYQGKKDSGTFEKGASYLQTLLDFSSTPPENTEKQVNLLALSVRAYLEHYCSSTAGRQTAELQTEFNIIRRAVFSKLPAQIPPKLFDRVWQEFKSAGQQYIAGEPAVLEALTHNRDYASANSAEIIRISGSGDKKDTTQLAQILALKANEPGFLTDLYLETKDGAKALAGLCMKERQAAEAVYVNRTDRDFTKKMFIETEPDVLLATVKALQAVDQQTDPPGKKTDEFLTAIFPDSSKRTDKLVSDIRTLTEEGRFKVEDLDAALAIHGRLANISWYEAADRFQGYNQQTFFEAVLTRIAAGKYPLPAKDRGRAMVIEAFASYLNSDQAGSDTIENVFGKIAKEGVPLETVRENLGEIVTDGFSELKNFRPSSLKRVINGLGYIEADSGEITPEGKAMITGILTANNVHNGDWHQLTINIGAAGQDHVFPPDIEAEVMTGFLTKNAYLWDESRSTPVYLWRYFPAESATDDQITAIAQKVMARIPSASLHFIRFAQRVGEDRTKSILSKMQEGNPDLLRELHENASITYTNADTRDMLQLVDKLLPPAVQTPASQPPTTSEPPTPDIPSPEPPAPAPVQPATQS